MRKPRCRLCGAQLTRTFVDLGMSPPCESYLERLPARLEGDVLPAPRAHLLRRACWSSCPAYLSGRGDLQPLRLLLLVLRLMGGARELFVDAGGGPARPGPELVRRRGRQQRRLPAPARRRPRHPLPRHRAGRATSPRWPGQGHPDRGRLPRARAGSRIAADHGPADLVVANNVFAHVPDIVDFTLAARAASDDGARDASRSRTCCGSSRSRVRHDLPRALLLPSLLTTQRVARRCGPHRGRRRGTATHGGSLRTWSTPAERAPQPARSRACLRTRLLPDWTPSTATRDSPRRSPTVRNDLVEFLIGCARRGKTVVAYGAPGKGNTLLNHCGIRADLLRFAVDRNPFKHGMFLPGTHIPIHPVEELEAARPTTCSSCPGTSARRSRPSWPGFGTGGDASWSRCRGSRFSKEDPAQGD